MTMAAPYTTVDTPTARNVPFGRLRDASFRSPDMLTPCVKPVTAGKKMANSTQKAPSGASGSANRLALSTSVSQAA